MAVNLGSLTEYVDQNKNGLIAKAVLGSRMAKLLKLQTGVKGQTALNLLNTNVVFQNGAACGWNAQGDSTLTQRVITPATIKINMSFCDKEMLKYFMNNQVNVAAGRATLPFEEQFIQDVLDNIDAKMDDLIWNGSDELGVTCKGILDIINDEGVEATVTAGVTVYEKVKDLYKAIKPEYLRTSAIFLPIGEFRDLTQELVEKNLYHYSPDNNADENLELTLPGTNMKVYGVAGLAGKAVALDLATSVYGTDMEGDEEVFDFWYSKDNQEFRLAVNFNEGVQVAFLDSIKHVALA